jgi:predicted component of type VI protein secretion system
MAKPRQKLKVKDVRLAPQARFYIQPETSRPTPRTVRQVANPWHDGMAEAKQSGIRLSRAFCLYPAAHSTHRFQEVCVDERMRLRERRDQKMNDVIKVARRRFGLPVE